MLVKECLCGKTVDHTFEESMIFKIPILKCPKCYVMHQNVSLTEEEYRDFYIQKYHTEYQSEIGHVTYAKRYEHDCEIAEQRMVKYDNYLKGTKILDIGASNGAFIDVAAEYGLEAWGLELSEELSKKPKVLHGTLRDKKFDAQTWDNVTMHDVLEHLIDPMAELEELFRVISTGGILIIDIPDYYHPEGEHHWRPIEHLWFFDKEQCSQMLEQSGFRVLEIDKPIPSKLVYYTEKKS